MSLSLDLPDRDYDLVTLTGAWARERYVRTEHLREGAQEVYSMRGHSNHQFNPFLALKRPNADEKQGEVLGSAWYTAAISLARSMWTPTESRECF